MYIKSKIAYSLFVSITFYSNLLSSISNNQKYIHIAGILQKLSINTTATIQKIPGSTESIAITVNAQQSDKNRIDHIKKDILEHAIDIFQDNRRVYREKLALPNRRGLKIVTEKINTYTDEQIESLIDYMAARTHPEICLLRECNCITRYNDFDTDHFIENDKGNFERMLASKYLLNPDANQNITYTGFASGGMFTDLRILTLLLAHQKELEDHILFTQDISEIKHSIAQGANRKQIICKKWKSHQKIKSQKNILKNISIASIHLIDPDYEITINTLGEYIGKDLANIQINKNKTLGDLLRIIQVTQLAHFISSISKQKITVCLHNYAKAYVDTCRYNNKMKPTIVTSTDHNVDNLLRFSELVIPFTHVEFMLMLNNVTTKQTWLGDLNWSIPEKIKPLLNINILVKNPQETQQYLDENQALIQEQKILINEYEKENNETYLSL